MCNIHAADSDDFVAGMEESDNEETMDKEEEALNQVQCSARELGGHVSAAVLAGQSICQLHLLVKVVAHVGHCLVLVEVFPSLLQVCIVFRQIIGSSYSLHTCTYIVNPCLPISRRVWTTARS